jgi:hypothetical protein
VFLGGITLSPPDVSAVAAFLRTINALENIRSSIDLGERADGQGFSKARELLHLSRSELDDAIGVLGGGDLTSDSNATSARTKLATARGLIHQAFATPAKPQRDALIDQALELQAAARDDLVNP